MWNAILRFFGLAVEKVKAKATKPRDNTSGSQMAREARERGRVARLPIVLAFLALVGAQVGCALTVNEQRTRIVAEIDSADPCPSLDALVALEGRYMVGDVGVSIVRSPETGACEAYLCWDFGPMDAPACIVKTIPEPAGD